MFSHSKTYFLRVVVRIAKIIHVKHLAIVSFFHLSFLLGNKTAKASNRNQELTIADV